MKLLFLRLQSCLDATQLLCKKYYDKHNIGDVLDTQESSRLVSDAAQYSSAYGKVRSARAAISNLSTFEKTVLAIEEFDLEERLKGIEAYLSKKDETRRAMKAEFSIQGGKNFKANAVANMVLDLFVRLNREINLTKTSATKHTSGNAPSSLFARCVDEALKITHTDGRQKSVKFETSNGRNCCWHSYSVCALARAGRASH